MIRHSWLTALTLLTASAGWADEPSEARAVVDRAIRLIGGEKKLSGLTGGVWKTNGTVRGNPSRADFHGELPGKFRIDSDRVVNGETVRHSRIVNGDRGWVVEGDRVTPMSDAEVAGVKASFYHKQAATTLIPLTEKGVELELAGKAMLPSGAATQVKVRKKSCPDLLFTFDDKTGLLVKSEMTDRDPKTQADRKVEIEWREYKEFDGVKMAAKTKTYHDGELFIDTEIVDFQGAKSLPDSTFTPNKR